MESLKKVYRFLSSMKTGLVLLVLVGLASALGSAFMPDMFYLTSLFKLLLIILIVNMVFCTVNRSYLFISRNLKNRIKKQRLPAEIGGLLLHAGIVFILIGLMVNTFYGQTGQIAIKIGDTVDISHIMKVDKPFSINLVDFKVDFNEDGSPAQYSSYVNLLEDGETIDEAVISVNHPLNKSGVKFYQQSYGYLVQSRYNDDKGNEVEELIEEGNILELAGTERTVKVFRYIPNFDPELGMNSKTMRPDNPRVVFSVYDGDEILGVGAAEFGERVKIDDDVYVVFKGVEPFTVLKVKSDPGLPVVFLGGGMFIIGLCLALLLVPVRGKTHEGKLGTAGR